MKLRGKVKFGLLIAGLWAGLLVTNVQAELSKATQELIAAHREAAVEAQKKVAFHEQMAANFKAGRGGSKIDMVGHCRFWSDYYRKVATQEEQAAKELEQTGR